jgi:hypothetical protein
MPSRRLTDRDLVHVYSARGLSGGSFEGIFSRFAGARSHRTGLARPPFSGLLVFVQRTGGPQRLSSKASTSDRLNATLYSSRAVIAGSAARMGRRTVFPGARSWQMPRF